MTDQDRLDRLEREMAILRAEFAKLRERLGAREGVREPEERRTHQPPPPPRDFPPPPPRDFPPPPPRDAPPPRPKPEPDLIADMLSSIPRPRGSIEDIIGRYGFMAVAMLLILVGLGAFLGWAVRNGYLDQTARVILGYAVAGGIALAGARIRMRGTREFGNVLMAMALGVVHLVSWYAGPRLEVIPSWGALAISLVASAVLAEFALRHDEQMLCAIGFGGAALAPFIAGDSGGNRIALAAYGVVVVALGAAALGSRQWRYARAVVLWSIIVYTLAAGTGWAVSSPPEFLSRRLYVITPVVMLLALIPFTHAENRRGMIRSSAAALILGALFRADKYPADLVALLITLAGTIIIIGALDLTRPGALEREAPVGALDQRLIDKATLLDAFLIPVGLFIATIAAAPSMHSVQSALLGVLFAAGAAWMTWRTRGELESGRYATTASFIALWIVPAAFADQRLAAAAGSAAMGILLLGTGRRMNHLPFAFGAIGSFLTASIFALEWLDARGAYTYLPFLTWRSLAALAAVAGWIAGARIVAALDFLPELEPKMRASLREVFISGAALTAFFWGILELRGAWNPTAATSLLIVYYAATGALAIYLGRLRNVRHLRLAGITVALWAAWKALDEASDLPNALVRMAVYFAVATFLIGIGYWYRNQGSATTAEPLAPSP
jgi:hypothetical protein